MKNEPNRIARFVYNRTKRFAIGRNINRSRFLVFAQNNEMFGEGIIPIEFLESLDQNWQQILHKTKQQTIHSDCERVLETLFMSFSI